MVRRIRKSKPVRATIAGIEAESVLIPAVVVADKTDRLGKRLAFLSFGLLILYFVTSTFIQSAQNGKRLDTARKERAKLISSLDRVTLALEVQSNLVIQLQIAVEEQNRALTEAGVDTKETPTPKISQSAVGSKGNSTPTPVRTFIFPNVTPRPTTDPKPKPKPKPTTKPGTVICVPVPTTPTRPRLP